MIQVTVWNEYLHEREHPEIAAVYPEGIHGCIRSFLEKAGLGVKTATLDMAEHGLTQQVLDDLVGTQSPPGGVRCSGAAGV